MIFNMLEYERMNKKCITAIKGGRNIYYEDAVELGVEYDAISSLFSQLFLRQLKSEIRSSMLSGSIINYSCMLDNYRKINLKIIFN